MATFHYIILPQWLYGKLFVSYLKQQKNINLSIFNFKMGVLFVYDDWANVVLLLLGEERNVIRKMFFFILILLSIGKEYFLYHD